MILYYTTLYYCIILLCIIIVWSLQKPDSQAESDSGLQKSESDSAGWLLAGCWLAVWLAGWLAGWLTDIVPSFAQIVSASGIRPRAPSPAL